MSDNNEINNSSGLRVTLFGSTGKLGLMMGEKLGRMGSEMVYPQRYKNQFREESEFLQMTGTKGHVYIHKRTNFNNPNILRRLMQNSNVIVNLIGPSYKCRTIE